MNESFLMLARRIFGHHLWLEPRTFSRAEAWLDLLQTAAWAPHKRVIAGHVIEIPRGGLVAAVRWLSDRWKWSNTKVCLFLDVLAKENMITREKRHGITLLIICKYDVYNNPNDAETTGKRQKSVNGTTPGRHRDDEREEGKEGIKAERELPPWEHVREHSRTIGLAEWKARDWFDEMEACGWLDHLHRPVASWKPLMARVKAKWEADGRPSGPPASQSMQPARQGPGKQSKFAFSQPLYDDSGRMTRNAAGQAVDPETGHTL